MGDGRSVFNSMFSLLNGTADAKRLQSLDLPPVAARGDGAADIECDLVLKGLILPLLQQISRIRVTRCPHYQRKHYAKSMCSNCYHKLGRQHTAWLCRHKDRPMYAKGRCQYCYLRMYSRKRLNLKSQLHA